jgi:hypothetical protein
MRIKQVAADTIISWNNSQANTRFPLKDAQRAEAKHCQLCSPPNQILNLHQLTQHLMTGHWRKHSPEMPSSIIVEICTAIERHISSSKQMQAVVQYILQVHLEPQTSRRVLQWPHIPPRHIP